MLTIDLYHCKSLSKNDNELVLTDKTGNKIFLYKKEKKDFFDENSKDIWVLYDTIIDKSGNIKPTTAHRMKNTSVNILPFEDIVVNTDSNIV